MISIDLLRQDTNKKRRWYVSAKLAHPARFERATFGFVDRRSIHLSYGCARLRIAFYSLAEEFWRVDAAISIWI